MSNLNICNALNSDQSRSLVNKVQGTELKRGCGNTTLINIALLALTIIAAIGVGFAISATGFHLWMVLLPIGIALSFCVNNTLPYFLTATPALAISAAPALKVSEDENNRAAERLVEEIDKHLQCCIQLTRDQINDGQNPHIQNRDRDKISRQFQKDIGRLGRIAIEDLNGNIRIFKEDHLCVLDQLRALASPDEVFNDDLFLLLQESFSQTVEAVPARHLAKLFRNEKGYEEIAIIWNKLGVKLRQTGLTTFEMSYVYNLALKTSQKSVTHRVVVMQELDPTGITRSTRRLASPKDFPFTSILSPAPATDQQLLERS